MKPSFTIILCLFVFHALSQPSLNPKEFNLVFYNLENLFDTYDDPKINDDEFLPRGDRHWTTKRFNEKIARISKVILSSCKLTIPDIVGVCEVENRFVLEQLLENTPLKKFDYKIIHKDSPDPRGIDVALIYRPEKCSPVFYEYFPLIDESGTSLRSREILYACLQLFPIDTLHVFFNHWPSRYGGQMETEQKRIIAAKCLSAKIEEIKSKFSSPKIVLMGDFNDEPQNQSISKWLNAKESDDPQVAGETINLSSKRKNGGTLKHQQAWAIFDQIIISDYLLQEGQGWLTKPAFAEILDFDFLMEDDQKFQGKRLFRTYNGFKYNGGFSDHLPVRLKLVYSD